MSKTQPIGIFDSGVGGTSIWKEIHELLPHEHTIYLADSSNAPYGEKPREEIVRLSFKNTEKLLDMGAKIIVVACNTATTNAIQKLRSSFNIPFIGIEPAIKPAATKSQTKAIGILATRGTLSSELFAKTSDLYSKNSKVIEVIGNGLVPAIESGKKDSEEIDKLLQKLLEPMIAEGIDYLVLGCSHYPYLIPNLKRLLPDSVTIIDSGQAVAKQTRVVLNSHNLLSDTPQKPPEFFTNGNPEVLKNLINTATMSYNVTYLDF
ncbi:glutamate racemase [Salinimicrobium marinum]|uniref:Glutamate racemase n=1 Tax=Salinimicrobium marinum TaxID=680283 RepID=A0A918VU76_9FLAO|nr:glutamate racemase [Salinimicrobium marinum]GHA24481.1 glutamate racemase [Salinimicrobium marinum]